MTSPLCLLRQLSCQLLSQPRTPSTGRCLVSTGARNPQLNLRTRFQLTPHRQLTSQQLGAFAHTTQAVVSGALVFIQMLRVNALSIIPYPHPKLPFVIADFHFDPLRLCVLEGIAHGLAGYPVDFVPQDRMEALRGSFHLHLKLRSIWVLFANARSLLTAVEERNPWTASRPSVIAFAA